MSRRESWKTWVIVAGLLLFAGLASAAWPFISDAISGGSEPDLGQVEQEATIITIDIRNMLLGDELIKIKFIADNVDGLQFTAWEVFLISLGVVLVLTGALGLLFTLLSVVLGRQVVIVQADERYQNAVVELDNRQKAALAELREHQPKESPHPERTARWPLIATSIVILIFVWIAGILLGVSYFGDSTVELLGRQVSAAALFNAILLLVTLAVLVLVIRIRKPAEIDELDTDYNPVNWGYVWILLTGLVVVGIGAGLAVATRAAGAG